MGKWGGRTAFFVVVAVIIWAAFRSTQVERDETRRRLADKNQALVDGSKELLQRDLPGLTLDLSLHEALAVRSGLRRNAEADREGFKVFQEPLDHKKTSVLYFFNGEQGGIGRLERVQIATSIKGLEAVVERVQATQARLGPPDGVWDCPAIPGQLPTRRYAFRRGVASALEVYALIGEQTAVTYYVATTKQIRASVKEAACVPTPPERAGRFPVAVP